MIILKILRPTTYATEPTQIVVTVVITVDDHDQYREDRHSSEMVRPIRGKVIGAHAETLAGSDCRKVMGAVTKAVRPKVSILSRDENMDETGLSSDF